METLINEIKNQLKDAENAHSYCAMSFSTRIDTLRNWQDLLSPENIEQLIDFIDEQAEKISALEEENNELRESSAHN